MAREHDVSETLTRDILAPYVTNLDRPVFALRNLPEEVVAVLFAYYSRSTNSLRDNLQSLIEAGDLALAGGTAGDEDPAWLAGAAERAKQFHEKWVVGYGHASVAEHAVVHLAVEDISIVATKALEDNRLASYTEKSTRYVAFDADSYVREPALCASPLAADYDAMCRRLLGAYTALMPVVTAQIREAAARPEDWTERRFDSVCRSQACDILRYLLPSATRTNVGLTINGRALEHLLTKLYSSPLAELRELATALHREAAVVIPTLLKYAAPSDYLAGNRERMRALAAEVLPAGEPESGNAARLVSAPDDPFLPLAAAIIYEHGGVAYETARAAAAARGREWQLGVIEDYVAGRGRHDQPLRALEHVTYTFEVVVDQGAFRDIQRHRMCTQTNPPFTAELGYETPPEIAALGHGDAYHAALTEAGALWRKLADAVGPDEAQYVLPLAYRKRVLITWNLREMHHFIQLRSSRQGHRSYRRIAQQCWEELARVHPELAAQVRVDLESYDTARG